MNTDQANLQVAQIAKHDHLLRSRMTKLKEKLESHLDVIEGAVAEIDRSLKIQYTGWFALFKLKDYSEWVCVGCFDSKNLPESTPEDFDMCMPIPVPGTLPEWEGW